MAGWVEGRTLQARVPGGSPRLLEETKVSSFVPVFNLAILPFLEVSRELRLVRQKRPGRRLILPRFPGNLLEGRAVLARTGVSRGVLLTRARAVLTAANMAPLLAAAVYRAVHGGPAARRARRPAIPGGLGPTIYGKLFLNRIRDIRKH
jgi:hypothetical protein